MKKITVILATVMSSLIPVAVLANYSSGNINFSGNLVTAPCKIAPSSKTINIDFGDIYIDSSNIELIKRDFIKLQNCNFEKISNSQTQRIDVKFFGQSDLIKSELLKVSGQARGIAIRMIDSVENNLDIANNNIIFILPIHIEQNRDITLPFSAKIERNGEQLAYGNFSATATYQIEYK